MTVHAHAPIDDLRIIIPAGGAGTRLWPVSRAGSPKFLHDLTGTGRSLLQATWDRVEPLAGPAAVMVVTGARHEEAVRAQLPQLGAGAVIAEPSPRDSMAAIGLAAAVLLERDGDVIVGSFAADHVIRDAAAFRDVVREAVEVARAGYVATIGIAPEYPSTGFGYVHAGGPLGLPTAPSAVRVEGFTEKPDAATAEAYLATGEYRWNAGMFLIRAEVLLGHLAEQRPALNAALRSLAAVWDTPERGAALAEIWPDIERVAIDHAIAEPVAAAGGVAMVPGDFGWDDIGDFGSLAALLPASEHDGGRVLGDHGSVIRIGATNAIVVPGSNRQVVILGLEDVVVVDTPDAVLVTTRDRVQDVKDVVAALRELGREDLL